MTDALDEELAAMSTRRSPTRIGPVKRKLGGRSPLHALFEIDLREQSIAVDVDTAQDLRLRTLEGDRLEFPVHEVLANEPERLIVRASAQATPPLELVADNDPSFILTKLRDLLTELTEPGLAVGLAEGRASSSPPERTPPPERDDRLNRSQWAAFDSATAPGLHMVWGPPGTGKTRVLAEVLAHLTASGQSALLVSNTNVAVDEALLKATQATAVHPGQFVRVGTPSLREVAEHSFLPLDRACHWRAADQRRRHDQVDRQRAALLEMPALKALLQAQSTLQEHSFDPVAYEGAKQRLVNAERLAAARREHSELQQLLDQARSNRTTVAAELDAANASEEAVRQAAEAYQRIDHLWEEIARREDDLAVVRGALDKAGDALAATYDDLLAFSRLPPLKRLRDGARSRRLKEQRSRQRQELDRLREIADRDHQALLARRERVSKRVPELHALADPYTREAVRERLEAQGRARHAVEEAELALQRCRERMQAVEQDFEQARRLPQPHERDAKLVATSDALGLPQLSARTTALEHETAPLLEDLERLEREGNELERQIRESAGAVLQDASVVATTLAQVVLNRGVRGRRYDHVLVDEAAFALPPLVVLAASRAIRGVTLFGDFMQNGPISQSHPSGEPGAGGEAVGVRRWLDKDCFALLGLDGPSGTDSVLGCVALTEQHRFGPTINDLANRVAYGGLLEPTEGREVEADEVVLVDVAGFADRPQPDLRSGSGRTWMAGALVARGLAEHHGRGGEAVGIVVPYRAQQRLVASLILDAGLGLNVSVGTSHKFQGREFPVVVFDLVEHTPTDSLRPGWVASGRLHGSRWELDGLRLFNVAVTRARRRVYLIGDGGAIDLAREGPLAEVRAMIESRQIRVIPVRQLLGGEVHPSRVATASPPDGSRDGSAESVVRQAMAGYRLYNEAEVYEQLDSWLSAAKGSIWIWSPFVARRRGDPAPPGTARRRRPTRHPVRQATSRAARVS